MQRAHLVFCAAIHDWFEMQLFFSQILARLSDHEAEVSTKVVDQVKALNQVRYSMPGSVVPLATFL